MNPNFQPNNTAPYPQANPQYHQNNLGYPQQAQPGPNGYHNAAPVQSVQQNQPYPQPQPYAGGAPAYIPPNQYGTVQEGALQENDSLKVALKVEMARFEKSLKSGGFLCYVIWNSLLLIIFCITAWIFFSTAPSVVSKDGQWGSLLIGGIPCYLAVQSYFAISSYTNKNLAKADVVCRMMSIYLAFSIVFECWAIYCLSRTFSDTLMSGWDVKFFLATTFNLFMHIQVNMVYSFKLKKILTEKAKIEMKLIENSFNNNA